MKTKNISYLFCCLIPLSGCWVAAIGAGGEAGYVAAQDSRTVGETLDDQAITASIKTKLLANSETPGFDINVDTMQKRVTLRGYVKNTSIVITAVRIARETSGVISVDSRLIVDPNI